jgi:hypothetical protein
VSAGQQARPAGVRLGQEEQNTIKPTAISDGAGRLLWLGAFRPGRMHDVTALRAQATETATAPPRPS